MDDYLQQGIMAAKTGDRPRAFDLLNRASEVPATSERAWLRLSGVVNDDAERLFCLDNVLKINSGNSAAQRGAAMLRQKGVFPAVPVYPGTQHTKTGQDFTHKPASLPKSAPLNFGAPVRSQAAPSPVKTLAPQPQSSFEADSKKRERSGWFQRRGQHYPTASRWGGVSLAF